MKASEIIDVSVGKVINREVFYACLLLRLKLVRREEIGTFAVDGKSLFYSEGFIATLEKQAKDLRQLFAWIVGILLHEVEHVARLHMYRRGSRNHLVWNWACDHVINLILLGMNYELPPCRLADPRFTGMSEEQVYDILIAENPQPEDGDQSGSGEGDGAGEGDGSGDGAGEGTGNGSGKGQGKAQGAGAGKPSGLGSGKANTGFDQVLDPTGTESEQREEMHRTMVDIIRAAQTAKQHGKLPAHCRSLVDAIVKPKVDWRERLRTFLTAVASDDYSWQKSNRRYASCDFVMPSLHSERCGTIAVCIDTSGSVGQNEFDAFVAEIRDILSTMRPTKLILIQCDAEVQSYAEITDSADLEQVQINGGGGTDFRPPFQRIEEEQETPDVFVYLTDAYGTFPSKEPSYPTIWAITTDRTAPFGQTVNIDINN